MSGWRRAPTSTGGPFFFSKHIHLCVGRAVAMDFLKFKSYEGFAAFLALGAPKGYRAQLEQAGIGEEEAAESVLSVIELTIQKLWRACPAKVATMSPARINRSAAVWNKGEVANDAHHPCLIPTSTKASRSK